MFDDDFLACLQRIEARLNSDEYEYGGFWTVGGPTGLYAIHSPYNTECEWAPISFCALTGRGIVVVSSANNDQLSLPGDGSVSIGLFSGGADNNALEAFVSVQAANNGEPFVPTWQPLGRGASLFVSISMASGAQSGYFCAGFRRKLDRAIPAPPRRDAHTHSHVESRRGVRTFAAGFEAQYPRDKYIHEEIPESQDTANIGYVENLTPAQALLTKMRNGGR